jgi:hypothetical protein
MTSAADLLAIWDAAQGLPPLRRAQLLSRFAIDACGQHAQHQPPIGVANARMFALRRALFGSEMIGLAPCPSCKETTEIAAQVEDFVAAADQSCDDGDLSVEIDGRHVRFRLPTLDDIAAIGDAEPAVAAGELLRACIAEPADIDVARIGELVLARMAELDPLADATLALSCHACGHRFDYGFDIASFVWNEIEAYAAKTLGDVHAIARSYGWAEADILKMSPARRQAYLDLIGA